MEEAIAALQERLQLFQKLYKGRNGVDHSRVSTNFSGSVELGEDGILTGSYGPLL